MGTQIAITDHQLQVRFDGMEMLVSLARHVDVPVASVVGARVEPVSEPRSTLGWRVGGGYWPGWFATGHYTVPGRKGARQLWCVYRDTEVLVVDTDLERPTRLVLQHPDRAALAEQLQAVVDARAQG